VDLYILVFFILLRICLDQASRITRFVSSDFFITYIHSEFKDQRACVIEVEEHSNLSLQDTRKYCQSLISNPKGGALSLR
jgi:hypothetical protein